MSERDKKSTILIDPVEVEEVKNSVLERFKAIVTLFADMLLLVVWATVTWFVNTHVLAKLPLEEELDRLTLKMFQRIFFISTLAPVLVYTFVDICKVVQGAWKKIRE